MDFSMILVDDKLVLNLNFKLAKSLSAGLYDFSLKLSDYYEFDTAIEDSTYIILKGTSEILRVDRQSDIESKRMEKLLFRVKRDQDFHYLLENPSAINFSEYNTESLNNKLWYTINYDLNVDNSKKEIFINKDYYLWENDILKFGNIKYIVKQISIKSRKDKKEIREINFDFCPSFQTYYLSEIKEENKKNIVCKICGTSNCSEDNPLIKFCLCNYLHFECIKKEIIIYNRKEKENVKNYYVNNLKCKSCDFIFPLRFKLGETKYELIKIDIPSENDCDFIILESIEKKFFYGNMKLIHVIKFNDQKNIIKIGRNEKINDVVICDPSISREHAKLIYDKNDGKILIKNLSKKYGTLVFLKNGKSIDDDKNPIQIQTGKILITIQRIKMRDFKEIKKLKKTKYPLPTKY